VAAIGLAADQLAKLYVRASLPACDQFPIVDCARLRLGPLTLIRVSNRGTGYLFLRDPLVALALGLLGCALVLVYALWLGRLSRVAVAGVGLQAGGALSNVLDRLLVGAANDYVNLTPTFTFNLADALLLVGMVLAVAGIAPRLVAPP
jgi:signal peptidase II